MGGFHYENLIQKSTQSDSEFLFCPLYVWMQQDIKAYTVNEFCAAFRLSRPTVYRLIKNGNIRSVMVGRKRLIPADSADALLRDNPAVVLPSRKQVES